MLATPDDEPWWMDWVRWGGSAVGGTTALYLVALWPLLLLYPHAGWARSAVKSGAFSHAPILHKQLLSSSGARRRLFRSYANSAAGGDEPLHYIPQAVSPASSGELLPLARPDDPIGDIRECGRYNLILGRSGTGKSVLLHRLHRLEARRFQSGQSSTLPVLLSAPIHIGQKGDIASALKDALRRDGKVELSDDVLDFLIRKGEFLLLIDGLNELPNATEAIHPFLNSDASNFVLMASQTDMIRRQDVAVFTLAEVSPEQAGKYIDDVAGPGAWEALPPGLQALARNPQDLALIAEVVSRLGPGNLPSRRAALYAAKVETDSALRRWVETADPRLGAIYALAFRMLAERRVLDEPTLAEWVREALVAEGQDVAELSSVIAVVRRSRLFREVVAIDQLGRPQAVLTFDHELIGAFLAARFVRSALSGPQRERVLELADRETWQNVFFFAVDELAPAALPALLLDELLARGGDHSLRIVAYAIDGKRSEDPPLPARIQIEWSKAKMRQDLRSTPAA